MYIQGNKQYEYHVKIYGHPTKVGYKDVIPTWKAAKFDPDHLLGLYKKAGAKYFCSMGVHHDKFDLWNSKYQPRWNAVAMGPKRDIVGAFKRAAEKHGLRFAVSEHLAPSYHWFSTSHMSDKTGPLAGVPYDGIDPAYADLYHDLPKDYPYGQRAMTGRRRTHGSCITSNASKTWSITTSPICSIPMATSSLKNTAWRWSRISTISMLSATAAAAKPFTLASCRAIAKPGPACWTGSAASPAAFRPTPGRPTLVSATGTTTGKQGTNRPRMLSICWSISSAATAT